jgi:hypothetical protein
LLDIAYVFTNVDSFKLTKDLEGVLPSREVRATQGFEVALANWVEKSGSKGYVALRTIQDLILDQTPEFILANGIRHRNSVTGQMVSDIIIDNPDVSVTHVGTATYALGLAQLDAMFNVLVSSLATRFQNTGDARRYVRKGLEDLGSLAAGVDEDIRAPQSVVKRQRVLETILHPDNRQHLEAKVMQAIDLFVADKERKLRELESRDKWSALEVTTVRASTRDRWLKSVYPCYEKKFTDIEQALAERFDGDPEVVAWVKNSDSGRDWFALNYFHDGGDKLFYPDFLVKFKDGTLRIFEGKGHSSNGTAASHETKAKAERLQQWDE